MEEGEEEEEEEEEEFGVAVKPSKRRGGRGLKRGKRGSQKGGRPRKKGEAVAKRLDGASPRNRRVTASAERRVAGGEDWGGEGSGQLHLNTNFGCLVLEQAS